MPEPLSGTQLFPDGNAEVVGSKIATGRCGDFLVRVKDGPNGIEKMFKVLSRLDEHEAARVATRQSGFRDPFVACVRALPV